MICDICGKDFKNLGVHKYHVHKDQLKPGEVLAVDDLRDLDDPRDLKNLIVDSIMEKPLSELVSEIRELIRRYRNEMTIRMVEKAGKVSEIEIIVRIQL